MAPSILLTALFLAAPVRAQTARCPYDTVERKIAADSDECRTLLKLAGDFDRLAEAAGFQPRELTLERVVDSDPSFNAYYLKQRRDVTVNMGFVACAAAHPKVGPAVLAHEIGHAVQDREKISGKAYLFGRKAKTRRFESQADRIAVDLLDRAGYDIDAAAVDEEIKTSCVGSQAPDFHSKTDHPGDDTRAAEALRAQLARQRAISAALPGKFAGFGAAGGPGAVPAGTPAPIAPPQPPSDLLPAPAPLVAGRGFALAPDRYRPSVALSQFNSQGVVKHEKSLAVPSDVPNPEMLSAKNRKVELAPGITWSIPRRILANFTPDEIVAAVTRAQFPSLTDLKSSAEAGLNYIVSNQYWNLLPGKVTVKKPAAAAAPVPETSPAPITP